VLVIRSQESIPVLDSGWYTARLHFGVDVWSDLPGPLFRDLRTFEDMTLGPGGRTALHDLQTVTEIVAVINGSLGIVDDVGVGGIYSSPSVHAAVSGESVALRYFNESATEPVRFMRVCLNCSQRARSYVKSFSPSSVNPLANFHPLVLPVDRFHVSRTKDDSDNGSAPLEEQIGLYYGLASPGRAVTHHFADGEGGYLLLVDGSAHVATETDAGEIEASGAVAILSESEVSIRARADGAELLLLTSAVAAEP